MWEIGHITINSIAILSFIVGITVALKKPENWFIIHRACMVVAASLLLMSIMYSLICKEWLEAGKPAPVWHSLIGLLIGMIVLVQVGIAILFRKRLGSSYLMIHRIGAGFIVTLLITQIVLGIQAYRKRNT